MIYEYQELGQSAIQIIDGDRGKNYPNGSDFSPVGHCLFLNAKNVTADGFSFSERSFISKEKDNLLRKGKLIRRDTVLTTRGTVGNVAYFSDDVSYPDMRINSGMVILRPNPDVFDSEFVYWLFRSTIVQNQILQLRSGTAQPQLPIASLQRLNIPIPSLDIQRKIATIIGTLQRKIELNQKINGNLLLQVRAITKQWLVDNDRDYEILPLSKIAEINPDTYSPKEGWKHINYLDTSSITDGSISETQNIDPTTEKLPSRARRKIAANDVIFSTVRPNQRHFGIISSPKPNMLASTGFAVIRSKHPRVCNELIYLCLTENEFIEKMQQLAEQSTSTFPSIKPSDLGICDIPCPSNDAGICLTELLKSVFALIATHQNEIISLTLLREALLPKLMSGEIEVSNIHV